MILIPGPPGTGKTDTIDVALEAILRDNPDSRVAVVSQENVAVNEALKNSKERHPECAIVRHVSAQAADSVMHGSRHLTQLARREQFTSELEA